MQLTTDFECGGGKRPTQVGENQWRLEASGDASGYNKYFCVRVSAGAEEPPSVLELEIVPDSDLGEAGAAFFRSHFPSHVWYCGESWTRWRPLRNTWEDSVTFGERGISLRVPVQPGDCLHVASNPPLRYSDLLRWLDGLRARHPDRVRAGSLGASAEGREIPLIRLGRPAGAPRILVLAGQHPSEHCGNWACQGIVEWLLSRVSEAREALQRFEVAVVPMINPDGNVHGLSGANAEGIDLCREWAGAAEGTPPRGTENRRLWEWIHAEFPPDVLLHFHGYLGWRSFCTPPYDGTYRLEHPERVYSDPDRLAAYEAIQDRLAFETPALTASWQPGRITETGINWQLAAKFGTLSAFYEINAGSVGAVEQYRRGPQVLGAVLRALREDAA